MKKLLVIILALCGTAFTQAAPVVRSAWVGGGSNTGTAITVAPSAGDTLIVGVATYTSGCSTTGVKDNNGISLVQDSQSTAMNGSGTASSMAFFRETNVSTVTSVTPTFSASCAWYLTVAAVENLITSPVDVMDTTGHETTSGTTWTGDSVTTTNANDIVFGLAYIGYSPQTLGASSPWTAAVAAHGTNNQGVVLVYQVESATGSYAPKGTITAGSSWELTASYMGSNGLPTCANPTFTSPAPGSYTGTQTPTITSASCNICYSLTTTPVVTSGSCTTGISVSSGATVSISATATLSALAYQSSYNTSSLSTGNYTIGSGVAPTSLSLFHRFSRRSGCVPRTRRLWLQWQGQQQT